MANENNLIPQAHKLTVEEQSRAGKKSVEVRRKRKAMKEQMETLLALPIENNKLKQQIERLGINKNEIDNQMALIVSLYQTALKGGGNSVQAFNIIMEMMKEKEDETNKETIKKLDEVLKGLGGVI